MRREEKELCKVLELASQYLLALGRTIAWDSDFDTSEDLGRFISSCIKAFRSGGIASWQKRALWTIFAPTCEWDDFGGDERIGNRAFELLTMAYGSEFLSEEEPPRTKISPTGVIATASLEEPIQVKLRVAYDSADEERLLKEQATAEDVENLMRSLDWYGFPVVTLERPNGDWLSVAGNFGEDGLSVSFEESGEQFVIVEPPTTVEEMISILLGYLSNTDAWLKNAEWC